MPKTHSFFPTQIYQERIFAPTAKINRELLKESFKFQEIDEAGLRWSKKSYPGGYTSYGSLAELHKISPTFEELGKRIDQSAAHFIQELQLDVRIKDIKMCSLWVNIMPPGVFHTMHIHPLSVLSGSYYLQVPKLSRGLKFEDPRMVNFMASPPAKTKADPRNQRFVELNPKVGEVLLFESWLRHEVPRGTWSASAGPRVSISFNYDWK